MMSSGRSHGVLGLLLKDFFGIPTSNLEQSLSFKSYLACRVLQWKNRASPAFISTWTVVSEFWTSASLADSAPACSPTSWWSILPSLWEPGMTWRHPFTFLQLQRHHALFVVRPSCYFCFENFWKAQCLPFLNWNWNIFRLKHSEMALLQAEYMSSIIYLLEKTFRDHE